MPERWQQQPSLAPRQAVAVRIQNLVAARLGRGFVPLGILLVVGLGQLLARGLTDGGALALAGGAVAAAATLLANGMRIVQQAFGRPPRAWMSVALWAGLVPLVYAVYVLAWRGLRLLAAGSLTGLGIGMAFAGLGTWVMRSWMKLGEVERLARIMSIGLDEEVGRA